MATRESSADMVAFIAEIAKRYNGTMNRVAHRVGRRPTLDKDRQKQVALLQRMVTRFASGKLWHTDEEVPQINALAEWIIATHRQLNNSPASDFKVDPAALVKPGTSGSTHGR